LVLRGGKPQFLVRSRDNLASAVAKVETIGRWAHIAGVLNADKSMQLYVNGKLAAEAKSANLIPTDPAQGLEVGADDATAVGDYKSPLGFTGMIDEVRVYHAALNSDEIAAHASSRERTPTTDERLVLACTFEGGVAEDASGNGHDGTISQAQSAKGKFGRGLQFAFRQSRAAGSFVEYQWTQDIQLMVRAMVKANDKLFIAGPPDVIDEERTFERVMSRDPAVAKKLQDQNEALLGKHGGLMRAVSAKDGTILAEYDLSALPAWDGMAVADGKLYMSTADGKVVCYAEQ